jgi:hypothetical protein
MVPSVVSLWWYRMRSRSKCLHGAKGATLNKSVANLYWDLGKYIYIISSSRYIIDVICLLQSTRLECTFAHRMDSTRSHTPIQRVLAAAGVDIYARWEQRPSISGQSYLMMSEAEEAKWMEERNRSLTMLRDKKFLRRWGSSRKVSLTCGEGSCREEDQQTLGSAGTLQGSTDGMSPTNDRSDNDDTKSFSGPILYR